MAAPGEVLEVAIERIGAQGDGIARHGATPIYVPLALPGERWRVRLAARRGDGFAAEPLAPLAAVERQAPPCRHFGACGGCQLQHLLPADRARWQRGIVQQALARRGLAAVEVADLQPTPPASRRRVRLAFARAGGRVLLGFRERQGRRVIDLAECRVARPEIAALLPPLRRLLASLAMAGREGEIQLTASATGLDLLLQTATAPDLADRERLAAFAAEHDLARLAWRPTATLPPEPIAARREVLARFSGIAVALPPGAFLQASGEAEALIRAAVADALGDPPRIADLFAGCGTLGLPLAAAGRSVLSCDADATLLAAAAAAARRAGCAARFTTAQRDLERQPLAGRALASCAAVILDPPRAGAAGQAAALAASPVPRIAMVSCNPATFARDARVLVDGGYRLSWVRPIDAFLWSSQIELVGAFARPA